MPPPAPSSSHSIPPPHRRANRQPSPVLSVRRRSHRLLNCRPQRSSAPPFLLLILPLLTVTVLHPPPPAAAHGMMCTPRQRGAYHSQKCGSNLPFPDDPVTDYCAHCLNGGTVATVAQHLPPSGWAVYDPIGDFRRTGRRAGLCGDPKGRYDHMIGGDFMPRRYGTVPIVAHYRTGGKVDFVVEIDTNHNGYFEFFLCNIDKCSHHDIDASCFLNGHCYKLLRIPHEDCEDTTRNTHYECGPIDVEYPGRWYLPCRNTGHVGIHIVGGPSGTMRYRLPAGVRCKHCVLQWYWATANSCAPRGLVAYMQRHDDPFGSTCESDGGGRGTYRRGVHTCAGDAVPEEFWSCADISISDDGLNAGPVQLVAGNFTPPAATRDDGRDARVDGRGTADRARDEVKKDIDMRAREEAGERKRAERAAAEGQCLMEDMPCDGTVVCCDNSVVCVYVEAAVGFRCRYWWSLWTEKEYRDEKEAAM